MASSKSSRQKPNSDAGEKPTHENIEQLFDAKDYPLVKEALKKENQPVNPGDLSAIHNRRETGTSGGDQRASENEIKEAAKR